MNSSGYVILKSGDRLPVLNPLLWGRITGLPISLTVIKGGKCQQEQREKTTDQKR